MKFFFDICGTTTDSTINVTDTACHTLVSTAATGVTISTPTTLRLCGGWLQSGRFQVGVNVLL